MNNHRKPGEPNPDGSFWWPAFLWVLVLAIITVTILGTDGTRALLALMFG